MAFRAVHLPAALQLLDPALLSLVLGGPQPKRRGQAIFKRNLGPPVVFIKWIQNFFCLGLGQLKLGDQIAISSRLSYPGPIGTDQLVQIDLYTMDLPDIRFF